MLPEPTILHGRYLPTRPLGGGPVWIEVDHLRPEPDFRVGPDLARPVVFEWRVPAGTPAGTYAGSVRLAAEGASVDVPVRLRVFAVELPPIPIPVALFMNALPFGPEAVGEAGFWELTAAMLDEQARAGLTAVTGGPGLKLHLHRRDGAITISGDRALRFLALARAQNMARAVVSYGGFWDPLGGPRWGDPAAFAAAWRAFAAERGLPPMFFDAYDEPATPDELDAAVSVAGAFTRAGLFTMGFVTRLQGGGRREDLIAATYAPALHAHTLDDLRALSRRGQHPWVYNGGLDRRSLGLDLFRDLRAGAEGRLEWIGAITQGFAFDNLDGREPGAGAWVVHDRLGPMPTPRWLAAREGLLDLRIRLALEKAVPAGDPSLDLWPASPQGDDRASWTDAALDAARRVMLERIASSSPRPPSP
jgi:hypothetical protein